MPHRLYQTEGLILGRFHYGEANALLYALTPDLGLLAVAAQSVRALGSKLRAEVPTFAHAELSLVRGRNVWRLTGARKTDYLDGVFTDPLKLNLWARVAALVQRLVRGEQGDPQLFADLKAGLMTLGLAPRTEDPFSTHELLLVLRLLHRLGYLGDNEIVRPWLGADLWRFGPPAFPSPTLAAEITVLINQGLRQSGL